GFHFRGGQCCLPLLIGMESPAEFVEGNAIQRFIETSRGNSAGTDIEGKDIHDYAGLTGWPPTLWRMTERILLPKESGIRERMRSSSDCVMTGHGTPLSIASDTIQRPSPESATYGAIPFNEGFSARASAVRSSSHDRTTLP